VVSCDPPPVHQEEGKDMKGILEFNLPEDQGEFEIACKGGKYFSALHELDNYLRSKIKYSEGDVKVYEEIRGYLNDLMPGED